MKNLFNLLTISVFLLSCWSDRGYNVFENDFDKLADWGYNSPILKTGKAHSGIYYCGLDSADEYSMGFMRYVRDLPVRNLSSIKISAWVRAKAIMPKATLIVTIDSNNGPVKYAGFPLSDFETNPDQWIEIKGTLELPPNLQPDFFLKVYLYNKGRESVDIDDIRIELH